MKKVSLIIVLQLVTLTLTKAQLCNDHHIYAKFQYLLDLKWDYEKYKNNYHKRDSVIGLYKNQTMIIKSAREIYLKHINSALRKNKTTLARETVYYKYVPGTGEYFDKNWYKIKKIDLYRVIKYSLFKRNDEILPEDFRGLSVVNEKDYNGYDKNKRSDFKIATRFLMYNLPLATLEKKFIKNDYNQFYVLDMKKYLDKYGLNMENKEFIKWAIGYLIKYPQFSLAYLDNAYDSIRYRNHVPKDK